MRIPAKLLALLCLPWIWNCSDDAGEAGSEILVPYETLSGGMIFATAFGIRGSAGYDLYWVGVPPLATTGAIIPTRLTSSSGDEFQPSVSRGGNGIVFAKKDDGIFLIATTGRIQRVSDTRGVNIKDSLPCISHDGGRVAWVREDLTQPIGESGFFETVIMVSNFDGADARAVSPKAGVIQDAPVFEPTPAGTRMAWTEFAAGTLTAGGPQNYGIWIHDLQTANGRFACNDPPFVLGDRAYRCFGQHLAWPLANVLVLGQEMLEVDINTGAVSSIWPEVIFQVQSQNTSTPDIAAHPAGFFPRFPISLNYTANVDRLIFDGVVSPIDGDLSTLAFFISAIDGGGLWKLEIAGYSADIDQAGTVDYLFSLATPQFVP